MLHLPPINLWSMPKMNTPYYDETSGKYFDTGNVRLADYISKKQEVAGVKFDAGKPRMDLLDSVALEGLAAVLTFGANKYAANNWRGGLSYSRLIAALLRHTFAILRGERTDPESGLPHINHVGCCWMFLSNMMATRPDMDDLWKKGDNENKEGGVG